jgi:hypothetical protein
MTSSDGWVRLSDLLGGRDHMFIDDVRMYAIQHWAYTAQYFFGSEHGWKRAVEPLRAETPYSFSNQLEFYRVCVHQANEYRRSRGHG